MSWMTACPKCGAKDLRIIRCTVYGAFALEKDGFIVGGNLQTEHELVECSACGKRFRLEQLESHEVKAVAAKGGRRGT